MRAEGEGEGEGEGVGEGHPRRRPRPAARLLTARGCRRRLQRRPASHSGGGQRRPRRELLDALGIAQGVEGVLGRRRAWRDGGDHHGPGLADKRLFQDLGELRSSEGSIALGLIERADALFEAEQALIDLSGHVRSAEDCEGL